MLTPKEKDLIMLHEGIFISLDFKHWSLLYEFTLWKHVLKTILTLNVLHVDTYNVAGANCKKQEEFFLG